jgi:hypothetical protein
MADMVFEGDIPFCFLADFQYWDVESARGIANYGTRYCIGLFMDLPHDIHELCTNN